MKHYEMKEITEKKKILKTITCDSCTEEIIIKSQYYKVVITTSTGEWYWKTTDTEEKHYCCKNCMLLDAIDNRELFDNVMLDDFERLNIEVVNRGE